MQQLTRTHLSIAIAALLIIGAVTSCASTPPEVALVETRWDESRQVDVVYLPTSTIEDLWDGRVELALQASKEASTALLTVERRSKEFHYKECRKMSVSTAPEAADPVSTAYRSDLDLDVDDKLETFQATLGADVLNQLASSPKSAVILCEDRFELAHTHRVRLADFLESWTGERPEVPKENAAGKTPAASN